MFADVDSVEWDAPIVPGVSMVPIPLHASCGELDAIIAAHLIDADARRLNIPMKSPFPGGAVRVGMFHQFGVDKFGVRWTSST